MAVVAGDHHHLQTRLVHFLDGLGRFGFDRVGHGDDAFDFAVDADQQGGHGLGLDAVYLTRQSIQAETVGLGHTQVADRYLTAVDFGLDTQTGSGYKALRVAQGQAAVAGFSQHRLTQRVFAAFFHAGCQAQ